MHDRDLLFGVICAQLGITRPGLVAQFQRDVGPQGLAAGLEDAGAT